MAKKVKRLTVLTKNIDFILKKRNNSITFIFMYNECLKNVFYKILGVTFELTENIVFLYFGSPCIPNQKQKKISTKIDCYATLLVLLVLQLAADTLYRMKNSLKFSHKDEHICKITL